MNDFTVESMRRQDLDLAADWATREGWNPGLHDAEIFYTTDPKGFFIGRLNGEVVAMVSAVRYEPDFGFMGFYIVSPEFRDKGYGGRVVLEALNHLDRCCIGLDGVEEQQRNYARHGFRYAYPNIRFEGHGSGPVCMPSEKVEILPLAAFSSEEIQRYDRLHFPANRPEFLTAWITQPESLALGIRREKRLCGFGVRRRCRKGHKIAPLFADDPEGAAILLAALRDGLSSDIPFYLDVPGNNPAALAMAEAAGMSPVFKTARMYRGEAPILPDQEIYGITSFELG